MITYFSTPSIHSVMIYILSCILQRKPLLNLIVAHDIMSIISPGVCACTFVYKVKSVFTFFSLTVSWTCIEGSDLLIVLLKWLNLSYTHYDFINFNHFLFPIYYVEFSFGMSSLIRFEQSGCNSNRKYRWASRRNSIKNMYIVTNIGCTYSINVIQLIMIMYIDVPLPFSIYKKIRFLKCDNQFAQT